MNLNCHKWMLVDKVITGEPVYLIMVSGNFNFIQNHLAVKQFSYISPNYISLSCQENFMSEFYGKNVPNFRGKLEIHSNFFFFFQNSIDKNIFDRLNRLKFPETLA